MKRAAGARWIESAKVARAEDHFALAVVDPLISALQCREIEGKVGVGKGDHAAGGVQHGRADGTPPCRLGRNSRSVEQRGPKALVSVAVRSVLPSSATSTR